LDVLKLTTAFVGPTYVGTNRLGRPLTAAEGKALGSLLRQHDFAGASLIALNFAFKLARNKAAAQDLRDRSHVRLVEQGWDPPAVALPKCLCRFVWSEHMNVRREDTSRRKAEEVFLREQEIHHGGAARSVEDFAVRLETEQEEDARTKRCVGALRSAFVQADDTINLLWLDSWLDGVEQPGEMATRSGRDVGEFYRAAERRNRHMKRLLAAESGAKLEEDE
jgi:hypothetical protein